MLGIFVPFLIRCCGLPELLPEFSSMWARSCRAKLLNVSVES